MMKIAICPACGGHSFSKVLSCKDFTVSREIFDLVVCNACSFKFTNPRPEDVVIGSYYKSEDYISHSDTKAGLVARLYHMVRRHTLKKKEALVAGFVSRGTLLDYGCGTGAFLRNCVERGWKGYGIEPDQDARKLASTSSNNVVQSKETLDPSLQFNAITLWHVLEHVPDLDATISFFRDRLSPNGVLIIAVPNHKSFDAELYQENWAAYDVPRHLYHFHKQTIERLMSGFGFKLVDTRPMKFDSFYVSMLSEKYKSGSVRYLYAFMNGLRSNLKALSTGEYSSRIYIFKHA